MQEVILWRENGKHKEGKTNRESYNANGAAKKATSLEQLKKDM